MSEFIEDALYEGLLDCFHESGLAALVFNYEEWDITVASHFGQEKIHCAHPSIEASKTITAAINGTYIAVVRV